MSEDRNQSQTAIGLARHDFLPDVAWEDYQFCIFHWKDADGEHHFCGLPPTDPIHE